MVSEEGLTRLNRILESSGKVSLTTFCNLVTFIGAAAVEHAVAGTEDGLE